MLCDVNELVSEMDIRSKVEQGCHLLLIAGERSAGIDCCDGSMS